MTPTLPSIKLCELKKPSFLVHRYAMGVFNSKAFRPKHTKRDNPAQGEGCPSGTQWYNVSCPDSKQPNGRVEACLAGMSGKDVCNYRYVPAGEPFKHTERASDTDPCSPQIFYNTTCNVPGDIFYGCFESDPCISATSSAASASRLGEQRPSPNDARPCASCKGVLLKHSKRVHRPAS